jgi:hypothetical protein
MASNIQQEQHHALPEWYDFLRRHVVLSLLIVCEVVTNGGLVLLLVVHDVNDPLSWSWLEWLYALTLPIGIGLVTGGLAVSLSQVSADAFAQGRWLLGLLFFLVMLFYGAIEVWASLVERSATSKPTPADLLAFAWAGMQPTPITVSAIIFALMLPFSAVFVGFANRPKTMEDDETWEQKARRNLAQAELNAELAAINTGMAASVVGGFFRQAKAAAKGEGNPSLAAAQTTDKGEGLSPPTVHHLDRVSASPAQHSSRLPHAKGPWKKDDLMAYIAEEYPQVTLEESAALAAIKGLGNGKMKGTAYIASMLACKAWARKTYGPPLSSQGIRLVAG